MSGLVGDFAVIQAGLGEVDTLNAHTLLEEAMMYSGIHFPLMAVLAILFALRVLAQLVQAVHEVPFLPPFAAWQGSGLPYPVLLGSQVVILVLVGLALWQVKRGTITPRPWQYLGCFALGGVYFTVMAFRLVAGLTFLAENEWFASGIPALFHIILASLILIFGHYLLTLGKGKGRKSG